MKVYEWNMFPVFCQTEWLADMSALQAPCFKSKFITAELAHLFSQSDSEEEFEGFSEDEEEKERRGINKQLKNKVKKDCI